MDTLVLNRKDLYDLVWTHPMITLSNKYNISDNGLRKICIKLNIPFPKTGHWQKIQFGKKVKRTPLPSNYTGNQEYTIKLRDDQTQKVLGFQSPLAALQIEIENYLGSKLKVPDTLSKPDKLVVLTKAYLKDQKPTDYTFLDSVYSSSDKLDLRVSRKNIGRSLRFMDTLIKGLRLRGHNVCIKYRGTIVIVEQEELTIKLREKTKREKRTEGSWTRSVYVSTGILSFQIAGYRGREWKDGKTNLESQLSKIIAKFELIGIEGKKERIRRQIQEEKREAEQKLKRDFEMRRENDLNEFKELLNKASRWHKANNLRRFIESIEENSSKDNDAQVSDEWLAWARKKADWYDPFMEIADELLNEVDKTTLIIKKT